MAPSVRLALAIIAALFSLLPQAAAYSSQDTAGRSSPLPSVKNTEDGYALYLSQYPQRPFRHTLVTRIEPALPAPAPAPTAGSSSGVGPISKILVLAEQKLYAGVKAEIDRYLVDIHACFGCEVVLEEVSGGTAADLKALILQHEKKLSGVVGFGELPVCYFDYPYDYQPEFICDLFFSDLDGEWLDVDNDGIYEVHQEKKGTVNPEIFFARIDPAKCSRYGSPEELLRIFLDKDHAYWVESLPLARKALVYLARDWTQWDLGSNLSIYGAGSTVIKAENRDPFSRTDYLNSIANPAYSYVNHWLAGNDTMIVLPGGSLGADDIEEAKPQAFVFTLSTCKAGRFVNKRGVFLGGAYLYSRTRGSRGLTCLCSSGNGGGLARQEDYWDPYLGERYCIGQAFVRYMNRWEKKNYQYPEECLTWPYAEIILGDPLVTLTGVPRSSSGPRLLKVVSGSGAGFYDAGVEVAITANAAPFDQHFTHWQGSEGAIADSTAARAIVTMPKKPLTVTACYQALPATGLRMPAGNGNRVAVRDTFFYDDGGFEGDYADGFSGELTFLPAHAGGRLEMRLEMFDGEAAAGKAGRDTLWIYDGESAASPLLISICGDTGMLALASTSQDGSLTVRFRTDRSGSGHGWAARIVEVRATGLDQPASLPSPDFAVRRCGPWIHLRLPSTADGSSHLVTVDLFDSRGVKLRRLVAGSRPAGEQRVCLPRSLAAGTYLCRVSAGSLQRTVLFTTVK